MDANGLTFALLAEEHHWSLGAETRFDGDRRTVELRSARGALVEPASEPPSRLAEVPQAVAAFDTYAFFHVVEGDEPSRQVVATGAAPGLRILRSLGPSDVLSDITPGHAGELYLVVNDAVVLLDTRERFGERQVAETGFAPFRVAALRSGGAWVLERVAPPRVRRLFGFPFPELGGTRFDGDVFRPRPDGGPTTPSDPENPEPVLLDEPLALEDRPVAIETSSSGDAVILFQRNEDAPEPGAYVRRLTPEGRLGPRLELGGLRWPFSVGWLDDGSTIGVLVELVPAPGAARNSGSRVELVSFPLPRTDRAQRLQALGGHYPLVHYSGGPLARTLTGPARYPRRHPRSPFADRPARVVPLSAPQLTRAGRVEAREPLDAGRAGAVWHRLYVEAIVPPECGLRFWLAAGDDRHATPAAADYHLHWLGRVAAPAAGDELDVDSRRWPELAWCPEPSELPFHDGLLPCPPEPERIGLFTTLIQRVGRPVSSLSGRYLWVRAELLGNGRATPEVAALRAYSSRFSYVDQYLPRIYREQLTRPEADERGKRATGADFLERYLGLFESVLTPLESRIANAHLLTDPDAAPEEALRWLAQWVGLVFDPAYPAERRREALRQSQQLQKWHGTLRGLRLALDVATGGGVQRGEIVVVEDFRLRKTFATILGADLADEDDPLLAGIARSGNSLVGDTLLLGSEYRREFLSLFREVIPERPSDQSFEAWLDFIYQRLVDARSVDDFFDQFAHRITVLVQREVSDETLELVRKIVELESSAHVQSQTVRARHPFIVGVASLVGVDTFLRPLEPRAGVELNESRLGDGGSLTRPASLDPRLAGSGGPSTPSEAP